jgi:NAD(P)-dependent dehydrogenase (short-subunit alcohol dehydrogenase family)
MKPENFNGKTVLITGGGGGLGRALAWRFGRAGAKIAVADLDLKAAEEVSAALNRHRIPACALEVDAADEEACQAAVRRAIAYFGGLDVLINNAGVTHRDAFQSTRSEVYHRVMNVNFFGALYFTQAALPQLIESRGRIVVISSVAGLAPLYERTAYAASKHALHGFFESLRPEIDGQGVSVTMICPSFIQTGIHAAALDGEGRRRQPPLAVTGRVASPEQAAEYIFRATLARKRRVIFTRTGKLARILSLATPNLYDRLMIGRLGRPAFREQE